MGDVERFTSEERRESTGVLDGRGDENLGWQLEALDGEVIGLVSVERKRLVLAAGLELFSHDGSRPRRLLPHGTQPPLWPVDAHSDTVARLSQSTLTALWSQHCATPRLFHECWHQRTRGKWCCLSLRNTCTADPLEVYSEGRPRDTSKLTASPSTHLPVVINLEGTDTYKCHNRTKPSQCPHVPHASLIFQRQYSSQAGSETPPIFPIRPIQTKTQPTPPPSATITKPRIRPPCKPSLAQPTLEICTPP